jgi:hypothetical protein
VHYPPAFNFKNLESPSVLIDPVYKKTRGYIIIVVGVSGPGLNGNGESFGLKSLKTGEIKAGGITKP